MSAATLRRQPLAFGITVWGPLPETSDYYVMWDGPGSGLYFCAGDPGVAGTPRKRIEHSTASGIYATPKEADRAARAFVASVTDD